MTSPRRRHVPADLFGGRLADCFMLDLEVVRVAEARPGMRAIAFASPDLVDFEWRPGQDVMLDVPGTEGTRRRYTIRRADPVAGTLDIEVVLHGTGPFAAWAAGAAPGDRIEGIGPRGVVTLSESANHHLFIADPSAIPFTLAMLESIPTRMAASAVIVSDERNTDTGTDTDRIAWLTNGDLADHLASVAVPAGTAAYVHGERRLVRHAVELLVARGVVAGAIASKAYWRHDQANKAHGEPAKE